MSHEPGLYSHTPGLAELCRELFEDRDFSGSDWTIDITTNEEFEYKLTEYLTANDMSIYDLIAAFKNHLATDTSTNDIPYDQRINNITSAFTINQHRSNDTIMDHYMADYPQDMSWGSIMPVDPEMSIEPAPSNTDDGNFYDEVGISSIVSFNDPSSEMNPAGERQPGYRWCCGKWKKDDGNFKKHLDIHNKRVPCEAGNPGERHCFKRFADNKARNRHYWVYHEAWAKENNIPIEKCFCEPCKTSFARRDFLRRHMNNFHSKEPDDKHEIVEGDGEEYAWVCRLKDTE